MFGTRIKTMLLAITTVATIGVAAQTTPRDTIGFDCAINADAFSSLFYANDFIPSLKFNAGKKKYNFFGGFTFYHTEEDKTRHETFIDTDKANRQERRGEIDKTTRRTDYFAGVVLNPTRLQSLALQFDGYGVFPTTATGRFEKCLEVAYAPGQEVEADGKAMQISRDHSDFTNAVAAYSIAFDSIGGRTLSARIDYNRFTGLQGDEILTDFNVPEWIACQGYKDLDHSKSRNYSAAAAFNAPAIGIIHGLDICCNYFFSERTSTYKLNEEVISSRQFERLYRASLGGNIPIGKFSVDARLAGEYIHRTDNIEGDITEPSFRFLPYIKASFNAGKFSAFLSAERTVIRPSLANTDGIVRRNDEMMIVASNSRLHSTVNDLFTAQAFYNHHSLSTSWLIDYSPIVTTYTAVDASTISSTKINFRRTTALTFTYAYNNDIKPWWSLDANIGVSWVRNPGSELQKILWQRFCHIDNKFNLKKWGAIDIVFNYQWHTVAGNVVTASNLSLDIDWTKSLLNDRLQLTVGVRDLLDTEGDLEKFYADNLYYIRDDKPVSRRLHLGIAFKFSTPHKTTPRHLPDVTPIANFDITRL